jgi:hypothetical protein
VLFFAFVTVKNNEKASRHDKTGCYDGDSKNYHHQTIMTPSQTIQLQALKLKTTIEGNNPSMIDAILENPANQEGLKKDFRNVCALISSLQFEELEKLCNLLDLSKREVISMALSDFIPKANAIVSEVDPFENVEAIHAVEGK